MVTPVFAFVFSILIHTQTKDTARGIAFTSAYNENIHGKHHKPLNSKFNEPERIMSVGFHDPITEIILFYLFI